MHPCGKWGCVVHSFYILLRNNSRTCLSISDYRQTFQDVQAFAKISDDHRNEKIRGNAYEGALMYTKYV